MVAQPEASSKADHGSVVADVQPDFVRFIIGLEQLEVLRELGEEYA
jgi:hypothetical protein